MRVFQRYVVLLVPALSVSLSIARAAGSSSACQSTLLPSYASAIVAYPALKDKLELVAQQQVAQWYTDRVPDVAALAQTIVLPQCSNNVSTTPSPIVIYGLPEKDCAHGYSTSGSNGNAAAYRVFVQQLADAASTRNVVYILEPDAIGLLAAGACGHTKGYAENLKVAIAILSLNPNAEIYLDVGYWTLSTLEQAAAVAAIVMSLDTQRKCKGIALNVSNYRSTAEMMATCERFVQASGHPYKCIIDTSRNFVPPGSTEWCNAKWAGIGALPTSQTGLACVSRFVWIKPPGESDGECTSQSDLALRGPKAGTFCPDLFQQLWDNGVFVQQLGLAPIQGVKNSTKNSTTGAIPIPKVDNRTQPLSHEKEMSQKPVTPAPVVLEADAPPTVAVVDKLPVDENSGYGLNGTDFTVRDKKN